MYVRVCVRTSVVLSLNVAQWTVMKMMMMMVVVVVVVMVTGHDDSRQSVIQLGLRQCTMSAYTCLKTQHYV